MTARIVAGALLLYILGLLAAALAGARTPEIVALFYQWTMAGGLVLVVAGMVFCLAWVVVKGPDA